MFDNKTTVKVKTSEGYKEFEVFVADTEEERATGLSQVQSMNDDEGMLFIMPDGITSTSFTMSDMSFPLDIIFVDNDLTVFQVVTADAGDEDPIEADSPNGIAYVLEVNVNSGINPGDTLELDYEDDEENDEEIEESDEDVKMYVLDPEGNPIMDLFGGERIVSRKETLVLIKKAKVANREKTDSKYKSLGKYLFKVFDAQDHRDAEYVNKPE